MAEVFPHVASLYDTRLSWCGEQLLDRWQQGAAWRFSCVDSALMSARHPGAARPCPACVAAIVKQLTGNVL